MPETHRFLRGMVAWIGGRQVAFPYERDARFAGVTKYPLRRMLALATDAITGFSIAPLRFTVALAAVAVLIAMALAAHVAHGYLLGTTVSGWASLGMMIAFFSACQLLALGFIGEYLGRCFQEIKRRPLYQVREVLSRKESP